MRGGIDNLRSSQNTKFSREQAQRIDFLRFDLRLLIARVGIELAQNLQRQKMSFEMQISPEMPRFFNGAPLRINDMLWNVICYGLKYLYDGGLVLNVNSEQINDDHHYIYFKLQFSDFGISQYRINAIGGPYNFSSSRISFDDELSLYIAKVITAMMGGDVSIHKTLGVGTTYTAKIKLEASPD